MLPTRFRRDRTGSSLLASRPTALRVALVSVLLAAAALLAFGGVGASASTQPTRSATASTARSTGSAPQATVRLLNQLNTEYLQGFPSHNTAAAAHARGMAGALTALAAQAPADERAAASATVQRLVKLLSATSFDLQIWPEPSEATALISRLKQELGLSAVPAPKLGVPAAISAATALAHQAGADAGTGHTALAAAELAETYAVFAGSLEVPLDGVAPEQVTQTERHIWTAVSTGTQKRLTRAADLLASDLHSDAASLGQVTVSRATIVSDAAIILFREGLEAVLILAAITASMTGERRRLRRLVLVGAGFGLLATAITYVLAQVIIDALGDGGLRLQAITGIIAIVVLLVVTNWFFHKIYWSEWISRFNRRRKALEKVEKWGFISGQALGFILLGLTSVYREGFETVLFLQNLQVSAGTGATLLGIGIGLAGTLAVGLITFALGRKLPYKKLLILTGVLIGIVLAVMVGITVNNLQGLGWIPSSSTGFTVDPRVSQWLGLYATWEGIGAQIAALLVVYGSYALSRQMQGLKRRRAMAATASAA